MSGKILQAIALLIVASLSAPPAHAQDIPADVQVRLQTAMLNYNDAILDQGSYHYLDTDKDRMSVAYPANAHPFIVTLGESYFVCSEFIDAQGNTITADYLVRQVDGEYRVVQMILDDRKSLQKAMKKAKR